MPDTSIQRSDALNGGAGEPAATHISGMPRRSFLSLSLAGLVAACSGAGKPGLVVGDQRGGMQSIFKLSDQLASIPYAIQWAEFPNAAPMLEAVAGNAVDLGIGGDAAFIFALQANRGIQAVAATRSTGMAATIMVEQNSPIRRFADLVGKRVATPKGSNGHFAVLAGLQQIGQPLDAVHFIFISPTDGQAAVTSGAADAWAIWDPYGAIAEVGGTMRPLPLDRNTMPAVAYLFASEKALKEKQDALRDFIRRFRTARAWAVRHPDEQAKMLSKETGMPLPVTQLMIRRNQYAPVPIDDALRKEQQGIADLFLKAGLISKPVNVGAALQELVPF